MILEFLMIMMKMNEKDERVREEKETGRVHESSNNKGLLVV